MKKMSKKQRDLLISDWITDRASKIWKYGESKEGETNILLPDSPDDLIIDTFQVTHFRRYWKKVGKTVELRFYRSMEDGEMAFGATLELGPVVMTQVCSVYPTDYEHEPVGGQGCVGYTDGLGNPENPQVCKLKDLNMSIRASECLKAYGLENATLEQFSYMSRKEVREIPGVGNTTFGELGALLKEHGLTFRS